MTTVRYLNGWVIVGFIIAYALAMFVSAQMSIWNFDHNSVVDFSVLSDNWSAIAETFWFGLALPMVVLGFAWRYIRKSEQIVLTPRQKLLMVATMVVAVVFIGVVLDNALDSGMLNLSGFSNDNQVHNYLGIGQIMLLAFAWVAFRIGISRRPCFADPDWPSYSKVGNDDNP